MTAELVEQDATETRGFGVTLTGRFRHAILWRARQRYGSNKALAKALGISATRMGEFLNLKRIPTRFTDQFIVRLVEVTGHLPEDLFPSLVYTQDFLDAPKTFEHTRYVDPALLAHAGALRLPVSPDAYAETGDLSSALSQALETLTPREEKVLRLHYGLDGDPMTLYQLADKFELSHQRVRQIEAKALRKLRHPSRSRGIRAASEGLLPRSLEEREARFARRASRHRRDAPRRTAEAVELRSRRTLDRRQATQEQQEAARQRAARHAEAHRQAQLAERVRRALAQHIESAPTSEQEVPPGMRMVECPICHRRAVISREERKLCYHAQAEIDRFTTTGAPNGQ